MSPAALAAGLGLAGLTAVVLVATATWLGDGLSGGVLGETSPPRASNVAVGMASSSVTPVPTASPTPVPTPSAAVAPTPRPTAAATPRPTPRPTQPPAADATAPARDPAETVRLFYDLVEDHEFDAAARLWTRSMRERYPPDGYIDGRFAPTTRIDIDRIRIERMSVDAGTALVSIAITEYRSSGPSPRSFAGSWELVLSDRGWLMNEPHF